MLHGACVLCDVVMIEISTFRGTNLL